MEQIALFQKISPDFRSLKIGAITFLKKLMTRNIHFLYGTMTYCPSISGRENAKAIIFLDNYGIVREKGITPEVITNFYTQSLPPSITRKHVPDTVERVKELSKTMSSAEIADHLNKNGYRTPEGRTFTVSSISWLRYRYKIPGLVNYSNELTVKDVASKFNVSPGVVYYWLETGKVQGKRKGPGYPYRIIIDETTERKLSTYADTSTKIIKVRDQKVRD